MVPYTLDANDMRFATPQGFNSGDQFFAYLKDSFDTLHAEGGTAPKMMSVASTAGSSGDRAAPPPWPASLDYVRGHDRVWVARRVDIARHWIRHHPPAGGYRPSRMGEALFVEVFGGVFEHTPEVARAAHRAGLGPAEDTAEGLHAAMVAAMRALPRDGRRALLDAHPDLAGRLALAKGLTAESTDEQAGAGLDRLSAEDLARFTDLNGRYRSRFGFPFIMAVKGRSRDDVLAAFEDRLGNDEGVEFDRALAEVERIALLRLRDRLPSAG